MRFFTKLVVFAVVLTAGLGAWRIVERVRGPRVDRVAVVDAPEPPAAVAAPEVIEAPVMPELPIPASPAHPGEVRIVTLNRAAWMALRDDQIVAGLSDSLRRAIQLEIRKDMSREKASGVGSMIGEAVVSGVNKLLDTEVRVPVSDIRDIRYAGDRIVIVYKGGEAKGILNLETVKGDGDRSLLQQFSPADAERFVQAVKVRIR